MMVMDLCGTNGETGRASRKRAEQSGHVPTRRTFPSNNYNRLWGFYSQIFAKSLSSRA